MFNAHTPEPPPTGMPQPNPTNPPQLPIGDPPDPGQPAPREPPGVPLELLAVKQVRRVRRRWVVLT